MVKGSKSRKKLSSKYEKSGISRFFQEFENGEKVVIKIDPSSYNGAPHHRFHGKIGKIIGKRGRSYLVKVSDRFKEKTLIVQPQHLKRLS
ncbi:MAG: 50S ribosomal protein L21e [Candidatus Aenigmatarchaeota archaeon]